MSMLQAKEVAAAAASSLTRGPKSHQRYINRDHEAALSGCDMTTLTMIACTPVLLLSEVSYTGDSFPKHYA
jgi:hypothetical protein